MKDGHKLKELLRLRNITQQQLAEKLGVTRVTIGNLVAKDYITEDYKIKICEILALGKDCFTSKEAAAHGINTDPDHILTAEERATLWDIIRAQKDVIEDLRRQLRDEPNSKE